MCGQPDDELTEDECWCRACLNLADVWLPKGMVLPDSQAVEEWAQYVWDSPRPDNERRAAGEFLLRLNGDVRETNPFYGIPAGMRL